MRHGVSTIIRIPHPGAMPPTVLNGIPPQEILNNEARNIIPEEPVEADVAEPVDIAVDLVDLDRPVVDVVAADNVANGHGVDDAGIGLPEADAVVGEADAVVGDNNADDCT